MNNIDKPFISVLTPVYNRQDTIARCIKSIVGQDYLYKEHIIINDGSTDGTENEVKKFVDTNNSVTLINLKENKGVNYAWNRGLEAAKGDYIILLGSDDYFTDGAFSFIAEKINKYPELSYFLFVTDDRKESLETIFDGEESITLNYFDWISDKYYKYEGDYVHVIKKSLFEDKENFHAEIKGSEGVTLFGLYIKSKKQILFNKVLVNRDRERKDSLTNVVNSSFDHISLANVYRTNYLFIEYYFDAYFQYNRKVLKRSLLKLYSYGVACKEFSKNEQIKRKLQLVFNQSKLINLLYETNNILFSRIYFQILHIKHLFQK